MRYDPSGWYFFLILLAVCAAGSLCCGIFLLRIKKETLQASEKLGRCVWAGVILGTLDVFWCIPHAQPILPDSLHKYLPVLAIVLLILCWKYLDHPFARAAGGFMILSAHALLREAFAFPMAFTPVFAAETLVFGTLGIILSGKPHLMREAIRLAAGKKSWKYFLPGFFLFFAATDLVMIVLLLLKGKI